MITISHLTKIFEGKGPRVTALEDVNLEIGKGDIYGIIGMSGAGKSTLLRCLTLLERPTSGQIMLAGQDIASLSGAQLRAARRGMGVVFQGYNLLMQKTVAENVAFPLRLEKGYDKAAVQARVAELLAIVGLEDRAGAYPAQLSGGQKQRVAIAGVIAMRPDCLVLDEATAMLDPIGREKVMRTVHRLNDDYGITVVQITHYMEEAATADRVVVMSAGRVVMEGTPKEVFRNVEELRALHLDVPQAAELCHALTAAGCPMADDIIDVEECAAALYELLTGKKAPGAAQEKAEEVSACPQS